MKKQNNKIKIISYNLKYNRANTELTDLVSSYDADILCIQECHADKLPDQIADLSLADKTVTGRFHLAIYYKKDRFSESDSSSHILKHSLIEKIYMPQMERLLVSKIYDRVSQREITIGSFHATHHVATNYLRREQIRSAHKIVKKQANGSAALMVGDYNYLLFKKGLKLCIEKTGYELSMSDRPTYYMNKYLKARFDFATSLNSHIERVLTLPKTKLSDHAPILVHMYV
ncbi:MAG: endonuclease/exonuclease/phosphatase family protein [Bdellovibrionales bacterium]